MEFSNLTDEQLVDIIRREDQELYKYIIHRYEKKLFHYIKKYIFDSDNIKDVLQTVFIKAYKNLYGFDINRKFSSWIYRIAHNEAINNIKKKSNNNISLDEIEYKIIDEVIDLNKEIDEGFLKKKINKSLYKLKLKYREPLILFYFEEKTYEEISDILKIPRNTVGTFISRGKEKLKKIILEENEK
jgi:RNA polymerase sigma-70 factor (ECF subfamily)